MEDKKKTFLKQYMVEILGISIAEALSMSTEEMQEKYEKHKASLQDSREFEGANHYVL